MAVLAMTSASGSPGVTTTAIALACAWPRPVMLVEADPTGGSAVLAGFFRGARTYHAGLLELALSNLDVAEALSDVVQPLAHPDVSFLAGTRSHTQAVGLRDVWQPLSEALADLENSGQDVIVDAGRLGLVGSPEPLINDADLTLLVSRTSLPALATARSWAETAGRPGSGWRQPGALLIGEGQPYRANEVAKVLDLPVIAAIPDDPQAASVYHRGAAPPQRFDTSAYARGVRAAVDAIQTQIARSRAQLHAEPVAEATR